MDCNIKERKFSRDTGHGTRDTGHGTRDTGHGTRVTLSGCRLLYREYFCHVDIRLWPYPIFAIF